MVADTIETVFVAYENIFEINLDLLQNSENEEMFIENSAYDETF